MSQGTMSESDDHIDVIELLEIGTRCRELRKEKDMLKESQSQSFDLIKKLERHVKSLSDARAEDRMYIEQLEKELMNCSQEIDYLQDQISMRNEDVNFLEKHVHLLESRLADMEKLEEKVGVLSEDFRRSDSERELLMLELEAKDLELNRSAVLIEKLEESISSAGLESQCEIESMKLDLIALEQSYFEAKKIQEEALQEKIQMSRLMEEFEIQFKDAKQLIDCLEEENKELRKKLDLSETNVGDLPRKIEVYFREFLSGKKMPELSNESILGEIREYVMQLLSKLRILPGPGVDTEGKMKKMSLEIHEYELLVKQLREELREEKLKAKEETEDMAQEMAELRYQITSLLEEERKRHACIEQASLLRITELEAQVQREQGRLSTALSITTLH